MNQHLLATAVVVYQRIRDQIKTIEGDDLDERTLADTLEGLTDVHDLLAAVARSALIDEALAEGLKGHIALLEGRRARIGDRASKKRQVVRDAMAELSLAKIPTADFTLTLRVGQASVVVVDEARIPEVYWKPQPPKLSRADLSSDLKRGLMVPGATLSNPEPVLSIRIR